MAKASLKLKSGSTITIEGTPEEVNQLLKLYEGGGENLPKPHPRESSKTKSARPEVKNDGVADLNEILTLAKDCDEAAAIEVQILDRTAQVDRALLPLYIVHEYLKNAFGLTSGDITKITTNLGIPISQPNASRTLSGTASKYVIGDKMKVKGHAVRYKLSRRGVKYMKEVLAGNSHG